MDYQVRERWLQEEREYLQSMAKQRGSQEQGRAPENAGGGDSRGIADQADANGGRRQSRAQPIVPEPLASDEALQVPHVPKSPRDRSLIAGAVERNDFLRLLGEGQADAMVQSFMPAWHGPGHTVLAEGTDGDAMYIVAEGELSVTQRGCHLRTLLPGDVFGELAILYNCKRTATVTALTQVRLWAIDRQTYRTIVTSQAKRRRAEILDSLREAPSLQGLADAQLSKLLDCMEECTFAHDEVIVRERDEGNNFYIILRGEVRVSRHVNGREEPIRVLRAGEHFGELSLLRNIRRTATCRAHGEVACITITKEDFQEICPFCPTPRQLSEPDVAMLEAPSLPEPGQCAGGGSSLPSSGSARTTWCGGGSRDTCTWRSGCWSGAAAPSSWGSLAPSRTASTSTCCWSSARGASCGPSCVRRCLEEEVAVFCSACVVEGLDYLHGNGIIYRDLKPENLMLDKQGYIKLVDFGFAKELARGEKTYSFCGTPEYLAPEILRHEGHDFAVDFWMMGILIFEMLVGRPPFHSSDPQKIYSKILDGVFSFPAYMSEAACSLVSKLCRHRPGQRLGNTRTGIRGIRKHRWFGSVKWKRLALRQIDAPTLALMKQGPPYANFKRFSVDWTPAEEEFSGWDEDF
nr:cGMP-dependent protein kinase 1-like isoform X4 [Caretta caretta]